MRIFYDDKTDLLYLRLDERRHELTNERIMEVDRVLADFLEGIKRARPHLQHVTLFGSRARGEHRSDSDYDLLIVVDRKTPALSDVLYESVMEVLLTHGRLVSLKVFEREQFKKLEEMATPFIRRVQEEGVSL